MIYILSDFREQADYLAHINEIDDKNWRWIHSFGMLKEMKSNDKFWVYSAREPFCIAIIDYIKSKYNVLPTFK
jgi:hypothetical protein